MRQKLQEVVAFPKTFYRDFPELQEPSSQPNLSSYYKFIEGGIIIPQKFAVPFVFELEAERARIDRWMQISKSRKVEYLGLMEWKVLDMDKELSEIRERESTMREQL